MIYYRTISSESVRDCATYYRFMRHTFDRVDEIMNRNDLGWGKDTPVFLAGEVGSYDYFFSPILKEEGYDTFQEWLRNRRMKGLPAHVLDLFGSGYFIDDLDSVDSITGMRVLDSSEIELARLQETRFPACVPIFQEQNTIAVDKMTMYAQSGKWRVVPGNIYHPDTWRRLDEDPRQLTRMYDLVTVKPEGAFLHDEIFHPDDTHAVTHNAIKDIGDVYALQFLQLLDNAYTRTNPHGGMIATEVPQFIVGHYLNRFTSIVRAEAGVEIRPSRSLNPTRKNLKIVRRSDSAPNLRDVVTPHFLAA